MSEVFKQTAVYADNVKEAGKIRFSYAFRKTADYDKTDDILILTFDILSAKETSLTLSGRVYSEKARYTFNDSIKAQLSKTTLTDVKVTDKGVLVVRADTGVQQILSEIPEAKITDVNGKAVDAGSMLGSGMTVTLPDGESYTVVIKGDLDSNGSVTASDARLTLRASVGLEKNDAVWFKEAGNVHLDEKEQKLTASDARLILRASVRLENKDDWFNAI